MTDDVILVRCAVKLPGLKVGEVYPVEMTRYVRAAIEGGHLVPVQYAAVPPDEAQEPSETDAPPEEVLTPPGDPEAVTGPPSASEA